MGSWFKLSKFRNTSSSQRISPRKGGFQKDISDRPSRTSPSPQHDDSRAIPGEIIIAIFLLLDVPELVKCRAVCRTFLAIVDTTSVVQYHLELGVAGLTEQRGVRHMAVHERLALLKDLCASKREVAPITATKLCTGPYPGRWSHGRLFYNHTQQEESLQLRCGLIDSSSEKEARLDLKWWSFFVSGIWDAVALDPSQDILAVVNYSDFRVRILSLTDGTPVFHGPDFVPISAHLLEFTSRRYEPMIAGNILAIATASQGHRGGVTVILADWRARTVVAFLERPRTKEWEVTSCPGAFCLTSNTSFLLSVIQPQGIGIEVYTFGQDGSSSKGDTDDYYDTPTHTATYLFPEWRFGCSILNLHLRTTVDSECPYERNLKFAASAASSMLYVYNVHIRAPSDTGGLRFDLVVDLRRLLRDGTMCRGGGPMIFQWDSWGPRMTRTFPLATDYPRGRYIWRSYQGDVRAAYGFRFVLNDGEIWDFNTFDIALQLNREPRSFIPNLRSLLEMTRVMRHTDKPSSRIVTEPTIISGANVFKKDMITTLPYRSIPPAWGDSAGYDRIFGGDTWVALRYHPLGSPDVENVDLYVLSL